MEIDSQQETWAGYVDWRGRPALIRRHGGMAAASFVLVVEVLENLAYLANASNLVLYFSKFMHFSPSKSANSVTNFMGTAWLLALLGGFLSDAFFTTYLVFLISVVIEFLGLVTLTIQARSPSLKPPSCDQINTSIPCQEVSDGKAVMLFGGLYLVALGVGGIKGSLPIHGAEQFDQNTLKGRKQRSTFFNYFVFCLSCGALVAVTLVVWIEDNKGWEWGFGISTIAIFLSIPIFLSGSTTYRNKKPTGSPLTTIAKVLVASTITACTRSTTSNAVVSMSSSPLHLTHPTKEEEAKIPKPTKSLRFLNRAVRNNPIHSALECTVQDVEDVKVVLKVLPIFACTIMLNCCLAQLSGFSVEQAATMDTKIGSLKVPPASLPIFPVIFMMILAPLYDHVIIPFARRKTKTEMGISHLQRIGMGLVLSIIAMAVAALVEIKRKKYLFLGSADLFTLAGLLEFFFTEAPARMRSLATALSWVSLALGYYLSSVLVSVVNKVTDSSGHKPWLSGSNLNHYYLERFYWLMCVLSALNFVHYLICAKFYKYRLISTST
ncbi:hypothetical protein ACHQM5_008231 [Ranunculus cassubicifolius]